MQTPETAKAETKTEAPVSDQALEELEALTSEDEEIIAEAEAEVEAAEDAIVEAADDEELADDELADLELAVDRAEAYEAQDAEEDEVKTQPVNPKRRKSSSGSSAASKSKTPRDMASVEAKHFVLQADVSKMSEKQMEDCKTSVIATTPKQKKVADKFENLFISMQRGVAPSKYVVAAYDLLKAKGSMTTADLIAHFKSTGLGEGTARSQSGQIKVLFQVTGIANLSGKELTLTKGSNIAKYLDNHI